MKKFFFAFSLLLTFTFAKAQETTAEIAARTPTEVKDLPIAPADLVEIKTLEDTLAFLSYLIVNDSLDETRFTSVHKFIPTLVKALKHENSFHYPFDRLKTVSIQYPQDSTFRIFTWQVYVDQGIYHYYGAIQMNQKDLKLIPLRDRSEKVENLEQETLSADNWYGALYYNIRQFETRYGMHYALFGFDRYDFFNKRKIIDVLHFPRGQVAFGAPVFVSDDPNNSFIKKRILLEYSADASVRCNYDEFLEMITYDHLIELASGVPGQGATMVSDGSFEGFKYKEGVWVHISKLFDVKVDEAPRETPVLDERKKDIFGNN